MQALSAFLIFTLMIYRGCYANHDAKRLYEDLLLKSNYNKQVRPVGRNGTIKVKLGLKFTQLIDVDEKNEIITTNMWMIHEWEDCFLHWEPREYGKVSEIYVPSEEIWLPDVVLYNNADGNFTVTMMTKATLTHVGKVVWQPPVIFKSQCDINVRYFPFDVQDCHLKFSCWSYDSLLVDLNHLWLEKYGLGETDHIEYGVDITEFYRSAEWDLMRASAKKNIKVYPCCAEPFNDITFNITLRRKTLFYAVNLIIPCVSINMLTCLTFYLPCDSGEKITLCTSILMSLSLFQLLFMDLIPPTSLDIPLVVKYILFTYAIVSLSVIVSTVTLSINYRSTTTHKMPAMIRKIFMGILPRLLLMQKPDFSEATVLDEIDDDEAFLQQNEYSDLSNTPNCYRGKFRPPESLFENNDKDLSVSSNFIGASSFKNLNLDDICDACAQRRSRKYPTHVQKALGAMASIAKHMKDDDQSTIVQNEWKYVVLVIDRLFLWIYVSVCCVGTMGMLLNAPSLYDNTEPLDLPTQ